MSGPPLARGYSYSHLITDSQVSAHPCVLHTVVINKAATTAGVITLYDSLTEAGTVIGAITVALKTEAQAPVTLLYDVACATGLYVGFDGTIAGADITISYC